MLRRLPEKTKTINKGPKRFEHAGYQSRVFQAKIARVERKFAIAEKATV
jgi:hypothetical protein